MKVNYKSVVIYLFTSLAVIFSIYLLIQVSQPCTFVTNINIPRDQINFEKDIIIHLDEEDFNKHPVLREIITGEKPLSRIFIQDRGVVDRKEQQLIQNEYCREDYREEDYKMLVEWNGSYYELLCGTA